MDQISKANWFDVLNTEAMKANLEVQAHWQYGMGHIIDEMSLLFHDVEQRKAWEEELRSWGWERFNVVRDTMFCATPGPYAHFGAVVEFQFWRHEACRWRIESMLMLTQAIQRPMPLHDHALVLSGGLPVPVHASFKLQDEQSYDNFVRAQHGEPALSYYNSYGKFSYWGRQAPYIKPRVNLRDQNG